MTSCAIWCPAYASLNDNERQRSTEFLTKFSEKSPWDFQLFKSAKGPLNPGHWLAQDERLNEFKDVWQYDVAWAMRGGYGCIHLIEALSHFPSSSPPLLIGYSDLTVLHGLWQRQGWGPSCYAAMPALPAGSRALETLQHLLNHIEQTLDPSMLQEHEQLHILQGGQATGPLFTGCLSVLAGMIGSKAMPNLDGHLLCLEDIDERPYSVDRLLWQLYHAGHLDHITGFIGGRFAVVDQNDEQRGPSLHSIMEDWAGRLQIPFAYGLPFGHENDPIALPCGGRGRINLDGHWTLTYALT